MRLALFLVVVIGFCAQYAFSNEVGADSVSPVNVEDPYSGGSMMMMKQPKMKPKTPKMKQPKGGGSPKMGGGGGMPKMGGGGMPMMGGGGMPMMGGGGMPKMGGGSMGGKQPAGGKMGKMTGKMGKMGKMVTGVHTGAAAHPTSTGVAQPKAQPKAQPVMASTSCKSGTGNCKNVADGCSGGHFESGYCPGTSAVKCCILDSTGGGDDDGGDDDSGSGSSGSDSDLVKKIVAQRNTRLSFSYGGVSGWAQTARKTLIFNGKLSCDCDGYARCPQIDPDGQTSTSWSYGGKPIDAMQANYYVLPTNLSGKLGSIYKLGDIAAIMWNNKVVYAVYADNGPTDKAGEGSVHLLKDLGYSSNPNPRSTTIPSGVTYIVFPGSRSKYGSPYDLAGVAAAGQKLLRAEAGN